MVDRGEQKQKTRKLLIASALKLSAERGFSALSLREIAKAAGITPAGFYRHFHDIDELGLALIDEVGMGLRQLLRDARRSINDNQSAIKSSVDAFITYITENTNLFRVLQGERQGASSAFRQALFNELGRFIEEVAEDLERASIKFNQPLTDFDLAAEAIVAVSFTLGGEALDLPKHRRNELAERLVKVIKVILRGSLAKPETRPIVKKKKTSKKT